MSEEKIKEVKEEVLDTTKMNVFEKIQHVRVELQSRNLTKTGENKFSNFLYFELSDFIGHINELCLKYKLFTFEDINTVYGRISVVNTDNPDEKFELTIPTAEVELKGANKIQSIGGLLTYVRKYLYTLLFEIAETDIVDATSGGEEEKKQPKNKKPTDTPKEKDKKTSMKELCTSLSASGHKQEVMDTLMKLANVKNPNSITDEGVMEQIIKELEALQ